MAVRAPLYFDGSDLKEMSTAQVDELINEAIYQYSQGTIGVALGVVASGGNLTGINDTRLQAGAMITHASAFPTEAQTGEPTTVTVAYDKLNQIVTSGSGTADSGLNYPLYKTASNGIQPMNLQDLKDTILHPAIDLMVSGSTTYQQAGTYHINTSSSVTGSTLVDASPVYTDSRANVGAYTSGGIPETQDQPMTINNYYLHRINGVAGTFEKPLYIRILGNHDLQEYSTIDFQAFLKGWINFTAGASIDGYKITYNVDGSGTNRGSAMVDTVLTGGSGTYTTFQAGTDDYRAQEFPDGTATTAATHYLKILKS